jgi:hypothetical protein
MNSSTSASKACSNALRSTTSGAVNTALGFDALRTNRTAAFNTALAAMSLRSNGIGLFNTAVGHGALRDNSAGTGNTAGAGELDRHQQCRDRAVRRIHAHGRP